MSAHHAPGGSRLAADMLVDTIERALAEEPAGSMRAIACRVLTGVSLKEFQRASDELRAEARKDLERISDIVIHNHHKPDPALIEAMTSENAVLNVLRRNGRPIRRREEEIAASRAIGYADRPFAERAAMQLYDEVNGTCDGAAVHVLVVDGATCECGEIQTEWNGVPNAGVSTPEHRERAQMFARVMRERIDTVSPGVTKACAELAATIAVGAPAIVEVPPRHAMTQNVATAWGWTREEIDQAMRERAVEIDTAGVPIGKAPTVHKRSDCQGGFIADPHGLLRCTGCCAVAGNLTDAEQVAWMRVRNRAVRVYHNGSFSVGADPSDHVVTDDDRALAESADVKMRSTVEALKLTVGQASIGKAPEVRQRTITLADAIAYEYTEPVLRDRLMLPSPSPRPDGFSQSQIDAAKAVLLTTGTTRK